MQVPRKESNEMVTYSTGLGWARVPLAQQQALPSSESLKLLIRNEGPAPLESHLLENALAKLLKETLRGQALRGRPAEVT